MTDRAELEQLSSEELHDRAMRLARHRMDVGFLWEVLRTLPEAEAAAGDIDRSTIDILRPLALLNDLIDADEGGLADALRPLYLDYLEKHEGPEHHEEASQEPSEGGDG